MWDMHWKAMQRIIELGFAKEVYVRYNTNLSRTSFKGTKLFDLLPEFQDWQICSSLDGTGEVGEYIHLTNDASKGMSGRIIPINRQLRAKIIELFDAGDIDPSVHVVRTERSAHTSAQAIVNLFQRWYRDLGLVGCSSHSGRRTFITNAARKISTVGGSLRDVQHLAGHSSLQTTQRYIEGDSEARKRVVDLV